MDITYLESLISSRAQEGLYLEFKRGSALGKQNNLKQEIVKDVLGFANADGGTLIYGIAEERDEAGIGVAASLSPVSEAIDKDWLAMVIRDNSSPRFSNFDIHEIALKDGKALVVRIRPGSTAHQNLISHRYYQRSSSSTIALTDFQIRDLMTRGNTAEAYAEIHLRNVMTTAELHRYFLSFSVKNTGSKTLEKWWLSIELPTNILRDSRLKNSGGDMMRGDPLFHRLVKKAYGDESSEFTQIAFGDPFFDGSRSIIHPQQEVHFGDNGVGFPVLVAEIDNEIFRKLAHQPAISWKLYVGNRSPIQGEMKFADWCRF